jgi:hypothetical protein
MSYFQDVSLRRFLPFSARQLKFSVSRPTTATAGDRRLMSIARLNWGVSVRAQAINGGVSPVFVAQ